MLGPPTSELIAGAQAVIVGAALLTLGYLVIDLVFRDRALDEVDRWGLSFVGLMCVALILMLMHMATSGWLFTQSWLVRLLLAVAFSSLLVRRFRSRAERTYSQLVVALVVALLAVAVWGSPIFRMIPLTAAADVQLHNGWIDQLLAGATTPGAAITGDIPNYYPWLFHSVGAITTTTTPGHTPYHALPPLHLAQTVGIVLALFALGRALTVRAITGFGAALFGALSGGFGFVMLRGLDVVTDPRADGGTAALLYHGDLLFNRSYNLGFHNLAPPFPRDFAFALLVSFFLLLALRGRLGQKRGELTSGVALGLVGLTGAETFLVGVALALGVVLFDGRSDGDGSRGGRALRLLGPAVVVSALWFVPMAINYARYGGFVSITHIPPVTLPATAILVSWGVTTPLAIVGLIAAYRRGRDPAVRLCLLFAGGALLLLVLSAAIPELLGDAFDTLGRKHRYWPIFYLAVALFGALGLTSVVDLLAARAPRWGPATLIAVVTVVACASPVVASLALPERVEPYPEIRAAMVGEDDNLLRVLRDAGPGCEVAAPAAVSRTVFSFTGYPLVVWTGAWRGENRARIRWADIYHHVGDEQQRLADNAALVTATGTPDEWRATASRYGVDLVVIPREHAGKPALESAELGNAAFGSERYVIASVGSCESD